MQAKRAPWTEALFAFAMTRLALLSVGWVSQLWPMDPARPLAQVARGYWATPWHLLDIWIRSDSNFYMQIMTRGYFAAGPLKTTQSDFAFFPLYPMLLKPITDPIFRLTGSSDLALLAVVLISNAFLLLAVVLLYKLVMLQYDDPQLARRAIWFLLLFPTGFFLSAFYAEGLFLLLSVAALYAIARKNWALASIAICLLALTKLMGIVLLFSLILAYDWRHFKLREAAWFALAPTGLAVFLVYSYRVSGDLLAPFTAQYAWGKHTSWPWDTFMAFSWETPGYLLFERALVIGFLILIPLMILRLQRPVWLYGILLMVPNLVSGTLMGFGRHLALNFPIALVLARLMNRKWSALLVAGVFAAGQLVLFVFWCQFYNIW